MGVSNTILDFGFWILRALQGESFNNSNVASSNPNGITKAKTCTEP